MVVTSLSSGERSRPHNWLNLFSTSPKPLSADRQCGAPLLICMWFLFPPKAAVGGASWRSPAAIPSMDKKGQTNHIYTHTFGPLVVMPCCVMLCYAVFCRVVFTKALRRPQTSRRRSLVRFGRGEAGPEKIQPYRRTQRIKQRILQRTTPQHTTSGHHNATQRTTTCHARITLKHTSP